VWEGERRHHDIQHYIFLPPPWRIRAKPRTIIATFAASCASFGQPPRRLPRIPFTTLANRFTPFLKNLENKNLAIGSPQPEDLKRIEKEMNRPDTELIRKQIEFLKLFDPDYKHD